VPNVSMDCPLESKTVVPTPAKTSTPLCAETGKTKANESVTIGMATRIHLYKILLPLRSAAYFEIGKPAAWAYVSTDVAPREGGFNEGVVKSC
jgi:hypothetical protein